MLGKEEDMLSILDKTKIRSNNISRFWKLGERKGTGERTSLFLRANVRRKGNFTVALDA